MRVNSKTILADLLTPISIYLKIRDIYPNSVLLESSDYHGAENSMSIIAFSPVAGFEVKNGAAFMSYPSGETWRVELSEGRDVASLFSAFADSFASQYIYPEKELINGFFGYTAYDAVTRFEDVRLCASDATGSDLPEIRYHLYKYIVTVNHFNNELTITENIEDGEESRIAEIEEVLNSRNIAEYGFETDGGEESDTTDEEFLEMVAKGKRHCFRGDVFQIVLSRRFRQKYTGDDIKLYRALRSVNPSPYLFYFDYGNYRIFGSSPESHLKVKKGIAYIAPIAGTFRRTGDDEKDLALAAKLREDPKESAEHVMLVDLARNDLSRNSTNVKVEVFKEVQYYSHVLHLVSSVSGRLKKGGNLFRLFADTFPAGTLSGAPKVKAMQLIDKIEKHKRGIYGGCIGYIGFDGSFNQAITIRSFLSMDNTLYYQAGAGIVARSKEKSELQEVNNKLAALKMAIEKAAQNR
jgi:anthranilate synthase component 1